MQLPRDQARQRICCFHIFSLLSAYALNLGKESESQLVVCPAAGPASAQVEQASITCLPLDR